MGDGRGKGLIIHTRTQKRILIRQISSSLPPSPLLK